MFTTKFNRAILTFFLLTASLYLSAQLEPVLEVNKERAFIAQASQQKIDSFQVDTDKDSAEYKSVSKQIEGLKVYNCLLYTSPSPRDKTPSRMPSSA